MNFDRRLDNLEERFVPQAAGCSACALQPPFAVVEMDGSSPPFIRCCPVCGAGPSYTIELHRDVEPVVDLAERRPWAR